MHRASIDSPIQPARGKLASRVGLTLVIAFGVMVVASWPRLFNPTTPPGPLMSAERGRSIVASAEATVPPASLDLGRQPLSDSRDLPSWTLQLVQDGPTEPVPGAAVRVSSIGTLEGREPFTGVSDAVGRCAVPSHATPMVNLSVEAPGFVKLRAAIPHPPPGSTQTITLARSCEVGVNIAEAISLRPVCNACLYVEPFQSAVHVSRNPLAGAGRTIPGFRRACPAATSDESGTAVLRGLREGLYTMICVADGFVTAATGPVELGVTRDPITFELEPGHHVTAEVRDGDGNPLAGWDVNFAAADLSVTVETDRAGRATSPGFAAGTKAWVVVIRKDLSPIGRFAAQFSDPLREQVVLPHAAPVRIDITGKRRFPVTVKWEPAPEDTLSLELLEIKEQPIQVAGMNFDRARVDESRVPGNRGSHSFGGARAGLHQVIGVGTNSGVWETGEFRVDERGATVSLKQVVARQGLLSGVVLLETGAPVAEAGVELVARSGELGIRTSTVSDSNTEPLIPRATTRTAIDGRFRLTQLLPGRYVLRVVVGSQIVACQPVQVGTTEAVLALRTRAPGRLCGILELRAAHTMYLIQAVGRDGLLDVSTLVQAEGKWEFAGLPPGEYRLRIREVDRLDEPVKTPQGSTSELDLGDTDAVVTAGGTTRRVLSVRRRHRCVTVHGGRESAARAVRLEKLHPYDRNGHSVWYTTMPVGRSGVARFTRVPVEGAYGLTMFDPAGGGPLAWAAIQPGADDVTIRLQPQSMATASVTIIAKTPGDIALVPLGAGDVPLRETLFRPAAVDGFRTVFHGVPFGRYRAAVGLQGSSLVRTPRLETRDVDVAEPLVTVQFR